MSTSRATRDEIILLVDADADARTIYTEFFRYHGFRVVAVVTGRDALTVASRAHAIVTELLLPGDMDGIELIGRLKSNEHTTAIPLLVVTSCAWNTDRDRAEGAGCDLFLSKPCVPHELMRAVRRLLARSAAPAHSGCGTSPGVRAPRTTSRIPPSS